MSNPEIGLQRVLRRGLPFYFESLGGAIVLAFELFRMYSNDRYLDLAPSMYKDSSYLRETSVKPDSPMFSILQNSGDVFDGYFIAMGAYHLLTIISRGKISEKVRLGLAFGTSCAIVIGTEAGLLFHGAPGADLKDIPGGIIGAGLFVGSHLVGNRVRDNIRLTS